jgi:hypothetical protein
MPAEHPVQIVLKLLMMRVEHSSPQLGPTHLLSNMSHCYLVRILQIKLLYQILRGGEVRAVGMHTM